MTSPSSPDEEPNEDPHAFGMAYTQGLIDGLKAGARKNPNDTGPKPELNAYKDKRKPRR